jgi:hypothetical protein
MVESKQSVAIPFIQYTPKDGFRVNPEA